MPSLKRITPVVLTWNEAANIRRSLEGLSWAERVLVVDSGSDDGTQQIVGSYENAELRERDFDSFAGQWNWALTKVTTEWVLALDADYRVPEAFVKELASIPKETDRNGFFARFRYVVLGEPLRTSLYPDRQVFFRRSRTRFTEEGHRQRTVVEGKSGRLQVELIHEDRKGLDRWLRNQLNYARREADFLTSVPDRQLSLPDRLRQTQVLGPPAVFGYCLVGKALFLDGWAGWYYTLQRTVAEMILALALMRGEY